MPITLELTPDEHKTLMSALEVAGMHIDPLSEQASKTNKLILKAHIAGQPRLYPDVYHDFVLKENQYPLDAVRKIALTLLNDLIGRRGYRQEFDEMDNDIQNDILNDWLKIIEYNLNLGAEVIVKNIEEDISWRGGWDDIYYTVDEDTRQEMRDTWAEKIRAIEL
jgi:hypothetical protein